MPAYAFDFTTADGAQRVQFTLDDDRPLAPQLFQILEELRQRGLIIRGGPDEEIGAFWNGIDLDQSKTPQQLGLSPARQIELRMRPPPPKPVPKTPEPPIVPFVPKGGSVAALAGLAGAIVAWAIATSITDLGEVIDDYTQLDGVTAMLLGACVGMAALGADALRSGRNVALWAAAGLGLGAVGGELGALASAPLRSLLAGSTAPAAFVGIRVGAWALLGVALGVVLALPVVRRDARRLFDGAVFGFAGGAVGGLVYCFPGPSDVWQLLAFCITGGAVAFGLAAPALRRAAAILELEGVHRRPAGVLALREWGLDERSGVSLRREGTAATVEWKGGRFAILPSASDGAAPVVVSGDPIHTAIYLRNGDVIELPGARYRFRRRRGAARAAGSVVLFLMGAMSDAPAQLSATSGAARLVRCAPDVDMTCLVATVGLTPEELRLVAAHDGPPSQVWSGRLAGSWMVGPGVRVVRETSVPFKLMVLVDVSGSMRGEGVAFVRSAVRSFLNELPEQGIEVAVAPFESRRVAERIAGARFVSPREATGVLDALPPPDPAGNTALYSALRDGVVAVDRAVRAGPAGTRGGVLLITDGRNDVAGRRDDRGLLSGPDGRRLASETARRSGHLLWIVGAGNVDAQELGALAGPGGRPYIIALNPILLTQSLASVASQISTTRELVFGVPSGSRVRLARTRTPVGLRFRSTAGGAGGGGSGFTRLLPWRPPLYALPAYEGVADSTNLPGEVQAVMGVGGAGTDSARRWLLVMFFGGIAVVVGGMLPYVIWSAPVASAVAARPGAVGTTPAPVGGDEGGGVRAASATGLRQDVREAPPRKPDEITASSARKVSPS